MVAEWIGQEEAHDEKVAMMLGERVKELRKEKGWSQAELGEQIGTDSHRISR
ncbi:MAG: helix-turn-helix domain-containing protein [Acidimicrobiales bacterium]